MLGNLHGFKLLQPCLLGNLVISLVGIVFEMAHIGDVAYIAYLVADMLEIAEQDVEGDGRTGMAQMGVTIDGRSTDIHAHMGCVDRLKGLLAAAERIVNHEVLLLVQIHR